MGYAKLVNGKLCRAPRRLEIGTDVVYNPTAAMLLSSGYKAIRLSQQPEAEPGFVAVSGWMETEDEILQTWTVEPEGDISDEEALEILLGGEIS